MKFFPQIPLGFQRALLLLGAAVLATGVSRAQLIDSYNADTLSLGSLTSWTDDTGTNDATVANAQAANANQATVGLQILTDPTVGSTDAAFNGHQYVEFGTNQGLATASALFTGSNARTVVAVYDTPVGDNLGINPITGEDNNTNGVAGKWFNLQARDYGVSGNPYLAGYADDVGSGTNPVTDQLTFAIATYSGGVETLYYANGNGAVQTAVNASAGALDSGGPFTIGFDQFEESSADMNVGTVQVYASALSGADATAEIEALQNFYATAVPEPSTYALMGISLLVGGVFLRRRASLA